MKVCVQGLWHLGSVTAACLASVGHEVVGLDDDDKCIRDLSEGRAPLLEPGLDSLLASGLAAGRLSFTNRIAEAAVGAQVLWVAFDTPVDDDDKADVEFVIARIQELLSEADDGTLVLISSQMPVGSVRRLEVFARDNLAAKRLRFACSPENLRLGKALDVFLRPDRIVVGVRTLEDRNVLEELLSPITDRIEWMSVESAEMTKHAINAFLATSVTFANEIASICEAVGADAMEVERGLKSEMRIGPKAYLSPGGPFAGGTLARDIEFLRTEAQSNALLTPLLSSIRASNDEQKNWPRRQLLEQFKNLQGIVIAVWGLTYKPGTDTLRRSQAVELCDWLLEQGADVRVHDPAVRQLPQRWDGKLTVYESALDAVVDADALIIGTEWPVFQHDAAGLAAARPGMVLIDANRHLSAVVKDFGFRYIAVGTPLVKVE